MDVWLDHSIKKYRQNGEDGTSGANNLAISAAKNEFESFQVLIYANGENLNNVDVTVSNFVKGQDSVTDIYLYKQHYFNAVNKSRAEYSGGYYPDALLPKVDRYFHETRNTFPFNVSSGQVQGVWIDVGTTASTPAGSYTATVTVSADGKPTQNFTVNLTVWDFALPSTATYHSMFTYQRSYVSYGHGRGLEWGAPWQLAMDKVYNKAALYHRIGTTMAGNNPVSYTWNATSKILQITNWNTWMAEYEDVMKGTAILFGPYSGARMRATNLANAWRVDSDAVIDVADKEVAARQYISQWWDKWKTEGLDPWNNLFVETHDEPNGAILTWRGASMTDYQKCSDMADDVTAVDTGGQGVWKNAYVNAKYKAELSAFAEKGFFDPWIGLYVCDGWERTSWPCQSGRAVTRESYPNYPNDDLRHWNYLSCMSNGCSGPGNSSYSGQIDLSADAPAMYNRMISFVWWKYESKGMLYWGMNVDNYLGGGAPYNSIWYYGSNGDGHLIYPGVASKAGKTLPVSTPEIGGTNDIPIESIRLKYIRDAMEDLEYMELAKSIAGKTAVDGEVDKMFVNTDRHFAYWNLDTNSPDLFAAREAIANLVAGSSPDTPPAAPTGLAVI